MAASKNTTELILSAIDRSSRLPRPRWPGPVREGFALRTATADLLERLLTAGSAFDYPANAARAADDPALLVAVDFISGARQADFEGCDIVSLDRGTMVT